MRRPLAYAVLLCLAGAVLAVFAASRVWAVELTVRPEPLAALRTPRTGGDQLPWVPALALVGLAGAGAVFATRGVPRRVIGALLAGLGVGIAAGGVTSIGSAGGAGPAAVAWPVLCGIGGLLLAAGGGWTLLRGQHWPGMSARYDRSDAGHPVGPASAQVWEALDRGEDPTLT